MSVSPSIIQGTSDTSLARELSKISFLQVKEIEFHYRLAGVCFNLQATDSMSPEEVQ